MATTTNYGWDTPDDTDLVKDGAAAIRTLGSSIDTTTKNLNPETTLGDLAYRSATANVKTRLALGSAGQVLRVNSGGTAPEWAAAADSGAFTELASGTLSGASLDLQSISGSYRHLQLILRNYDPASSNSQLRVRFNNDSTANRYVSYDIAGSAGSAYNLDYIDLVGYQVDTPNDGLVIIDVPDYANASTWKTLNSYSMSNNAGTPANLNFYQRNGFYNQTAAITRVTVFPNTGNFAGGTYSLYGVK